uniref:Uncharacterized protein n=1 Tax=Alexandrium monilatum TaxID=311494 RepID=A0A7S4SJG2_9DINO|mmetsp:Transcript_93089/g.277917  ORF Transcript_93089/g.277917 Transcript_93089/m.277917 type:complete len:209 (-) Transcript_93089:68-694(-)
MTRTNFWTHAYVIRRSLAPEILRKLEHGFAADAALVSWANTAPSGRCFLFHPRQLLQQPGGADRWKDSDIFVQGELFKRKAGEIAGGRYTFSAERRAGSYLRPAPPRRCKRPSSTRPCGGEAKAAETTAIVALGAGASNAIVPHGGTSADDAKAPFPTRACLLVLRIAELRAEARRCGVGPMRMFGCLEKADIVEAILEAAASRRPVG